MSSTKKILLRNSEAVSVGCGCRRSKMSKLFRLIPRSRNPIYTNHNHLYQSSSTCWDKTAHLWDTPSSSCSSFGSPPSLSPNINPNPSFQTWGLGEGESVAVVKESDDPYLDFLHSIVQMILEKEISGGEALQELLNCFLSLNSRKHHETIVRAFLEALQGVFPAREVDVRGRRSGTRAKGT